MKPRKTTFAILAASAFLFVSFFASTAAIANTVIYEGQSLRPSSLADVVRRISAGDVVILGEYHDRKTHHRNQLAVLANIRRAHPRWQIHIGMELLDFTKQAVLDQWLRKEITDEELLQKIGWSREFFAMYRPLLQFPLATGGWAYALNIPRAISGKVARSGLDSLSDDEKKLLPPNFTVGNDHYYERFAATMRGHVPEEKIRQYFVAHSLWDDTIAWRLLQKKSTLPAQHVFVQIIGDFHVAYGGGLADRIHARGNQPVLNISQIDVTGSTRSEVRDLIQPHARWGKRGDFIFVTRDRLK